MITVLKKINEKNPQEDMDVIDQAAEILRCGGTVAFPTETVYGLGANALSPDAVSKIYQAKGRPSDNPLIVHIAGYDELESIVERVSPLAEKLIEAFWPGPLTIIFSKKKVIPYETSGGLETVAIRFPVNAIAQLLIKRTGLPIAAPSANSSGKPSPTKASHVQYDLNGKVDMIIDGGQTQYGLESTIVDATGEVLCLLRPGSVTVEMLEHVAGQINIDPSLQEKNNELRQNIVPKAPGMKYTHYAPVAKVFIVTGTIEEVVDKIRQHTPFADKKIGIMATEQTKHYYDKEKYMVIAVGDREHPETIGANLFKTLRQFDFYGVDEVYAEAYPETEIGLAIMNRLKKAAGYRVI